MDFKSDTSYLNYNIIDAEKVIRENKLFIKEAYNKQLNEDEYRKLMRIPHWTTNQFVLQTSTYTELSNAGLLNIFRNDSIKKEIIAYNRFYELYSAAMKEYNDFSTNRLAQISHVVNKYSIYGASIYDEPYMFHDFDWSYINKPNSHEFKLVENTAAIYRNKYVDFKLRYKDLNAKANTLILLISKELDARK